MSSTQRRKALRRQAGGRVSRTSQKWVTQRSRSAPDRTVGPAPGRPGPAGRDGRSKAPGAVAARSRPPTSARPIGDHSDHAPEPDPSRERRPGWSVIVSSTTAGAGPARGGDVERIGFVGLGTMGAAMAGHLAAGGPSPDGLEPDARPGRDLAAAGAAVAPTPAELAAACDVVVICVSDTPDVEAVLFGPDGTRRGDRAGQPRHRLLDDRARRDPGLRRPSRGARRRDGRRARLRRLGGRSEGHPDDLRRRGRAGVRARARRSSRCSAGRSPMSGRSVRARRSRRSTRSSWPGPTWASPRASSWRCRPVSTSSRSSAPSVAAPPRAGSSPTGAAG